MLNSPSPVGAPPPLPIWQRTKMRADCSREYLHRGSTVVAKSLYNCSMASRSTTPPSPALLLLLPFFVFRERISDDGCVEEYSPTIAASITHTSPSDARCPMEDLCRPDLANSRHTSPADTLHLAASAIPNQLEVVVVDVGIRWAITLVFITALTPSIWPASADGRNCVSILVTIQGLEEEDAVGEEGITFVRAISHSAGKCGESVRMYVGGVVLADMCDRRWRRHLSGDDTDDDVVSSSDS